MTRRLAVDEEGTVQVPRPAVVVVLPVAAARSQTQTDGQSGREYTHAHL